MAEPLPPVSVLLVDDRPENLLALEAVLEPLAQKLVRAQSGDAALRAVLDEQFAVILMDIRMPGLDGFATMQLLRRHPRCQRVPIIFLSAFPGPEDGLLSYSSGAVDYIMKPFEPEALRSKVSVFVHLRQHELALEAARLELEDRVAARTAELAEANAALAREVAERKAAERRLFERAFHDDLTGLANRALFSVHLKRRLARWRRQPESPFAVVMLDVDRFKIVNDSLGHLAGDGLLLAVAKRLVASLRDVDTVARLGGDEFAVLLEGVPDLGAATRLVKRVERAFEPPHDLDGREVFATASIGIAMMDPRYSEAEDLLRDADAAMYRAKEAGRARCQVFDVEMHAKAMSQLQLEADLRRAPERGELLLHYQPVVALSDQSIVGFEALVRWRHPERGLVGPDDFIPLAEETGLIRPIGRWVFREACRQLATWRGSGLDGLTMSVNLSAKQFLQPDLPSDVVEAAREAGVDLRAITLEITESVVMGGAVVEETLDRLSALGVSVSLDDFGTGYSCLAYLHRFPVNTLKVDRSFVSRIDTTGDGTGIVQTIIALAHNLAMQVTAEGVETSIQFEQLAALQCDHGQGHYFAAAMDATSAESFVREHREQRRRA
jgi:diguanylate cyclase (GGDEF)-like protein